MVKEVEHLVEDVIDEGSGEPLRSEDLAVLARSRSQVYGFLATAYNRLPDDQFAQSLSGPELASFLASVEETEDMAGDMREGWRMINSFIHASQGRPVEELKTELAVERTRLLRGIKPGYGPPPPYEGVYAPTAQDALGQAMLSVKNVYAESGVVLPEEIRDQPDFIGFELDFMRYLTEKEARAWADGDFKEAITIAQKEQAFLDGHINTWVPGFCDVMFEEAQLDFYRGVARVTKGYVQGDANTTGELVNAAGSIQAA
jgi:putative dimethyl sulfoxide reductase chaperone